MNFISLNPGLLSTFRIDCDGGVVHLQGGQPFGQRLHATLLHGLQVRKNHKLEIRSYFKIVFTFTLQGSCTVTPHFSTKIETRKYFVSPFVVRQREGKRREDNSVRVKNSFMAFLNWGSTMGGGFATPGGKNPSVAGIASTASTTSNSTSDSDDLSSNNDELDFLVSSYTFLLKQTTYFSFVLILKANSFISRLNLEKRVGTRILSI